MARGLTAHDRIGKAAGRGELRADALYPLAVFLRRLGIGRHSLAALRRRGLPLHTIGRRQFIDGEEAIKFLRELWAKGDGNQKAPGTRDGLGHYAKHGKPAL